MSRGSVEIISWLVLSLALSMRAQGQDDMRLAESNAWFATGRQQLAGGEVRVACESFKKSYELAARGGTLLNLADCHYQAGDLVLARQRFLEARALASRDGNAARVAIADERLAQLQQKLAWLTIQPPAGLGSAQPRVRIDGSEIAGALSEIIPVMAGEHVVRIEADGFEPRELKLTLVEGAQVHMLLEPLQAAKSPVVSVAPAAPETKPAPLASKPAQPARAADSMSTLRTVALAVGIAGLVAGLGTGAWAIERKAVVDEECDPVTKQCSSQAGVDANELGRTLAAVSTIAFVVGAAGIGAWLVLPGGMLNPKAAASERVAGVVVRGVF